MQDQPDSNDANTSSNGSVSASAAQQTEFTDEEVAEMIYALEEWLNGKRSQRISGYIDPDLLEDTREAADVGELSGVSILLDTAIRRRLKQELESHEKYAFLLAAVDDLEASLSEPVEAPKNIPETQ